MKQLIPASQSYPHQERIAQDTGGSGAVSKNVGLEDLLANSNF